MDSDEMRHFIQNFSFDRCKRGSQGFNRILIQLFGLLGNGKSSFINTCIYVWEDQQFKNWAKAWGSDGGSTTERIPYKLTENITLVDNRGCAKMDEREYGEIYAQLGNLLPLGKKVEWAKEFQLVERITRAEKEIKSSDFVFPVFIHSVRNEITLQEKEDLKSLFHTAQMLTGVFPIVVLTRKTAGSLIATEGIFRDIGVDRIFSFENYTQKDHMKTRGKHEELLKFLCEVIKDVQFRVEKIPRDPVKETAERRKFVLKYVHEADMRAKQREEENRKAKEKAEREKILREQEEARRKQREREEQKLQEDLRRKQQELERIKEQESQDQKAKELQAEKEAQGAKKPNRFLAIFKSKK
ncbi:uncharacterized protein [Engystomops pustulosus]|uniref:uncharacterized protein n=1 Tax=Engystomops pustulosus TaxID=76066 RepID=UPI003AFA7A0B